MSTLIPSLPMQAALIPIGCGPFVVTVLSILAAGFIAYVAKWLVAYLPMISDPAKAIVLKIIQVVMIGYIILLIIDFVFGINILNVRPIPVCG